MNTVNILVDGILLSASIAACFYCVLLSRRVRSLASANHGVGKGIADMTEAVERLNVSLEQTRMAARTESETLQRQLTEARGLSERTGNLLEDGGHQIDQLAKGLTEARQMVRSLERLADAASKRRARGGRPDWREALADGMPDAGSRQAVPRHARTGEPYNEPRPSAEGEPLLDAAALDQTEEADDPLPDVKPLRTNRSRHAALAQRVEA